MIMIAGALAAVVAVLVIPPIVCFIASSIEKAVRRSKPECFDIRYKPEYGGEFYRARLVGKVDKPKNEALYLVEIHPGDAAEDKASAWIVLETELREGHLLEKGKFYKLAFKEELYD